MERSARRRKKRKAHGGVRLNELDDKRHEGRGPVTSKTSAPVSQNSVKEALKRSNVLLDLQYEELPEELLDGPELHVASWSIIIKDSCLMKIRDRALEGQKESTADVFDFAAFNKAGVQGTSSKESIAFLAKQNVQSKQRRQEKAITILNIHGAEDVTDRGLKAIMESCPSLVELDIGKIGNITDACIREIATNFQNLQKLNLDYLSRASGPGLATVGELCPQLLHLSLEGCKNAPEWALVKIAHGCSQLVSLNLSFCPNVTDRVLQIVGDSCSSLQRLFLKGCRQVADPGVIAIASGCPNLVELNLMRWDFQYKITDMILLSIAEKCHFLTTLNVSGCDMLSDVGLSWLATGCSALVNLDLTKCSKLSNIGMRLIGEGFIKLKKLKLVGCHKVTDVGLRYIGLGCRDLEYLDVQAIAHISDGTIVDFGVEGLPIVAQHCPQLKHLNLASCFRLVDGAFHALAQHSHSLQHLNLANCVRISGSALNALIKTTPDLRYLNVDECTSSITDQLLFTIAHSNLLIETLRLSNCTKISNAGICAIAGACRQLQELVLAGCTKVSDTGILALAEAERYPGLRVLNLANLRLITETGISWLAQRCPSLMTLDMTGCRIRSSSITAVKDQWKYAEFRKDEYFQGMFPKHRSMDRYFIDEYGACWKAAIKIQVRDDCECAEAFLMLRQSLYRAKVAYREMLVKREAAYKHWVATRLQSIYRGRQARRYAIMRKMTKQTQEQAAIKIQRRYRHLLHERSTRKQRQEKYEALLNKMATKVQCSWRRKKARDTMLAAQLKKLAYEKKLNECAQRIQKRWRGKLGRKNFALAKAAQIAKEKEMHAASTKLQTLYRGRASRQAAKKKREEQRLEHQRRDLAARFLQTRYRGRIARKIFSKKQNYQQQLVKSALMIQRRWRKRKQMLGAQMLTMLRRVKLEKAMALRIQSAWRRRQGNLAAHLLRAAKDDEYYERDAAAKKLQLIWRGKKCREKLGLMKESAFEKLLNAARLENRSATVIQTRYRGNKARERVAKIRLEKKQRWKEIHDKDKDQVFYYNQDTGEIRYRMPQDLLDLMPPPICDNCEQEKAITECSHCVEYYCPKCHDEVHAGGKRRKHKFRVLYDFYNKRIDYGDGEFPSNWPTEIEQDEKEGWFLRIQPHREPTKVIGNWQKYVDQASGRVWYYNVSLEEGSYDTPEVFQKLIDTQWSKYYDPDSHLDFYYNAESGASTFQRPEAYTSPRREEAYSYSNPDAWAKYQDDTTGLAYYYNSESGESTYARPDRFVTPRQDQSAYEIGTDGWSKYLDDVSNRYFYYNHNTQESTFQRPSTFATPRASGYGSWQKYYDDTSQSYFYYDLETGMTSFTPPEGWVE